MCDCVYVSMDVCISVSNVVVVKAVILREYNIKFNALLKMKCETGAKNFKSISQAHLRARDAFIQQLLPLPF